MGLVVSTGPPVDTTQVETPTGDKKKTATEVTCREKNAELARFVVKLNIITVSENHNVIAGYKSFTRVLEGKLFECLVIFMALIYQLYYFSSHMVNNSIFVWNFTCKWACRRPLVYSGHFSFLHHPWTDFLDVSEGINLHYSTHYKSIIYMQVILVYHYL